MKSRFSMMALVAAAAGLGGDVPTPQYQSPPGFGRKFWHTAPRGSFWNPGPEHLPTGPDSRQVRRRRERQERRNTGRRSS